MLRLRRTRFPHRFKGAPKDPFWKRDAIIKFLNPLAFGVDHMKLPQVSREPSGAPFLCVHLLIILSLIEICGTSISHSVPPSPFALCSHYALCRLDRPWYWWHASPLPGWNFLRRPINSLFNTWSPIQIFPRSRASPGRVTLELCDVLSRTSRVASLVITLDIFASDPSTKVEGGDDSQESESSSSGASKSKSDVSMERYWLSLSTALQHTHRLRYLNIHIESGNSVTAWILRNCAFRLRSFHCDFAWDNDLVAFLNGQSALEELFLADYATIPPASPADSGGEGGGGFGRGDSSHSQTQAQPSTMSELTPTVPPHPSRVSSIHPHTLYRLSILECSYPDAVISLAPGRPLSRIKTCFSREDRAGKERELAQLIAGLRLSEAARRIRTLDLADSTYTEDFSLELLRAIVPALPDLRFVGTLVLPVGLERLQFFGLLRRLRKLHAVELEVSDWEPPPSPQAMRALASELRLYCTTVQCVVFVADFERTLVRVVNGFCRVVYDTNTDNLWREV